MPLFARSNLKLLHLILAAVFTSTAAMRAWINDKMKKWYGSEYPVSYIC
jgi:hypothetical protein